MRKTIFNGLLLIPLVALCANPADEQAVVEKLLDRIMRQEDGFVEELRVHSAIAETYIQETPDPTADTGQAVRDHYFLGKVEFSKGLSYTPMAVYSEAPKGFKGLSFLKNRTSFFLPVGFAQMALLDADGLNRRTYHVEYVRREFLGEVRCLVFDVAPQDKKAAGKFKGRIWVEDQDFQIVRFNGIYTHSSSSRRFFHFDSWRTNVAPGRWVPALIYVEESQTDDKGPTVPHFKAQTRLWGYNVAKKQQLEELASIAVEAENRVKDQSGTPEVTPLESQRSWERQAEMNILERLQKSGLLALPGSVDDVLNAVVNNLIVTNNLNIEAKCRVLLTTPLETFSVGQTVVVSRGLLDVLPDEASLAMVLSTELAHIALGHRTDTHFAFSDQIMLGEAELLSRLRLTRPDAEIDAAGEKAIEMLSKSPYKANLSNTGLFLKALDSRAAQLPSMIRANLGNQLASETNRARMRTLAAQAPPLEQDKLEQIAALPLGSRVRLDPWTNEIALIKTKMVAFISARDKLPFEITPFMIFLTRAGAAPKEQGPAPNSSRPEDR
jgi:hypothetical protein